MSKIKNNPLSWINDNNEEENKELDLENIKTKKYEKSSKEGLPEKWTRATFIVKEDKLKDLKDYAYTKRMTIKDVVDEMMDYYLQDKDITERRED